jgi:hypothetical protein
LRARRELESDPAAALALVREHEARYAGGALVQEREALAVEALARLGRVDEARGRLARLRRDFPQSPHLSRLAGLVQGR